MDYINYYSQIIIQREWIWIFLFLFAFSCLIGRVIIITDMFKAVKEDHQGEASGWATKMQSITQIFTPLITYSYLEIGLVYIEKITLNAYFLIGITCVFIGFIILILVFYDMNKNPIVFFI